MYLKQIDESVLRDWYRMRCTLNPIRKTFLKELYHDYFSYCNSNYKFDSITGKRYLPLGKNKYNYFLKRVLSDYIQTNKVSIKMSKNGLVYRGLALKPLDPVKHNTIINE